MFDLEKIMNRLSYNLFCSVRRELLQTHDKNAMMSKKCFENFRKLHLCAGCHKSLRAILKNLNPRRILSTSCCQQMSSDDISKKKNDIQLSKVDYNAAHDENTYVTETRAINDYILNQSDLEGLQKITVRNAYSSEVELPTYCYLKSQVKKRAIEKHGSIASIKHKHRERQKQLEADETYRRDFSGLIGHLKKTIKDQTKIDADKKVYGGHTERVNFLKGSARVVTYAIISNFTVMVFKFGAYLYTGSASMLSEAVHSLADFANQCLLAFGILQSIKAPSVDHPYGWSRARYVYSLISGVGIFFLGSGVSVYHGISDLFNPPVLASLPLALSVLFGSLLAEGATFVMAVNQVSMSAREAGVSFSDYVVRGRDPSAVAVLAEDGAAVTGLLIAASCLGLTSYTGNVVYDAVGSIAIGGLLGAVAIFLIRRNADFLVGRSIPEDRLKQIMNVLEQDIMVRSIHDVKATELGADTVRFKAEINFDGREITRRHLSRKETTQLLKEVRDIQTPEELERFLMDHGEQIIDTLGQEVDRIERNIKNKNPEVRHVDLEIL
ncbi:zinc transporter 9-like [Dendronephthya gigantea]|uniref:zinc transporter 9-like n=1 Tax=Dendronephthya gigantea TaxID=151771 RepID=UPI00106C8837|nr:zinc transporter 9-like [Dendronephthya gigantea]XP_028397754.1 zinc transporter 9-like [Dendronephthya gigantea]XP_028397755.1 zinc transporter 9-like [Dendronephthya gigantea]